MKNTNANGTTREAVLEAIAECDRLGVAEFLDAHGYRAGRYQVRHRGRSYPSKAILGVASGLRSADFFGGAAHTVRTLRRLGFEVREGDRVPAPIGLLELAREASATAAEPSRLPELPVDPIAYFASGSNRTGEIRGLALVGQDVGVCATEIVGREPAEAALRDLAGTDVQVFCDSGAFPAFMAHRRGKRSSPALASDEWTAVLALYRRLVTFLGEQLYVVAPDVIADQDATLRLLVEHRDALAAIAERGGRILVPCQKGELTQAEFAVVIDEVLAGIPWQPALPCRAAATTAPELRAFLAARRPAHVHLLGLGPTGPEAPDYLESVREAGCTVSMDACWIGANVGNATKGRKRARRYTFAQQLARRFVAAGRLAEDLHRELALLVSFGLAGVIA